MVRKTTLDKRSNKYFVEFLFTGSRDGDLGTTRASVWLNDINDLQYYITKYFNRDIQEVILWDSIKTNERKVPEVNQMICHIVIDEDKGIPYSCDTMSSSAFYSKNCNDNMESLKAKSFIKEILCIR